MPFLFKHGILTQHQQESTRSFTDRYPYAVLTRGLIDHDWMQRNLIEHEWAEASDFGENRTRKSHLYGTFECTAGRLYFFLDELDYKKVCGLGDYILDKSPFQTII